MWLQSKAMGFTLTIVVQRQELGVGDTGWGQTGGARRSMWGARLYSQLRLRRRVGGISAWLTVLDREGRDGGSCGDIARNRGRLRQGGRRRSILGFCGSIFRRSSRSDCLRRGLAGKDWFRERPAHGVVGVVHGAGS